MSNEIVPTVTELDVPDQSDQDVRLVELWLHGRGKATQKTYRAGVARFRVYSSTPLAQVSLKELQMYADSLAAASLHPATQRRLLATIKSLFAFGHQLGYLPFDTAKPLRLPAIAETVAERMIEESSLLRMIDLEPNARNAAILATFYGAGLRVSELVGLRWRNVQARTNGQGQLTVLGKRAKTRSILLPASVFGRLVQLRGDALDDQPVFRSRKGGHLDPGHVLRITKRAAKRAGLARSVRNHDLRHSHASHSLARGASLALISQTLGHSGLAATSVYARARPDDSSGRYLPL